MNLDELRSVQSKERQKDSLQNLRPSFYQEVGQYIADLEDERDQAAERATDPFSSPEVSHLTDEIETAKDVVEAIYERRMGKLVKQASLSAAGMAANDEGLTAEEADLFDDLVERIESNKTRVLDVLEGMEPAADAVDAPSERELGTETDRGAHTDEPPVPPSAGSTGDSAHGHVESEDAQSETTPPVPPQESESHDDSVPPEPPADASPAAEASSGVSPADVMGGAPDTSTTESVTDGAGSDDAAPADGPAPEPPSPDEAGVTPTEDASTAVDRVTVRITRDIGPILGIDDREYTLSSDDIVTLPEQNATPLLEQDAAESLE
ncbi:hypothetical protein G6M89_09885 [Natronolimnobius sp. AArcel1]|uniref:hypothetical protein n=1 Tax=Natronolimnobius sp. AArcel1 TaxID=1679093 RepID=UPI0013E9EEA3|nr:hypothetical protein [Natronolimnobius sp. AArcel1]NGM69313.1 hypothetical protein [Natronolimnobius sp. AArcel1]